MTVHREKKFLYPILNRGPLQSDEELYLYLILVTACLFAMLVHVVLLIFHLIAGIFPLTAANLCSLILFLLVSRLILRGHYLASGLLITGDVLVYCGVTTYVVGGGHGINFFVLLALIMQVIIPYSTLWVRGVAVGCCWLCFVGILVAEFHYTPLIVITAETAMTFVNANIGVVGVVIELIIGNVIRKVIADYNADRMEELSTQAYTDPLTGLHNRRYAEKVFSSIGKVQTEVNWCVAIMDIDDFKLINDRYGHNAGDMILKDVSHYLQQSLRKTDAVFRWGGEEFLVLLDGVDLPTAKKLLEKHRKNIASQVTQTSKGPLQVTTTIGAGVFDPEDSTASIEHCDQKLYEGKRSGKNKVII